MIEPKLRFKRDDGTEYPEWKEKQLQSISEIIMGQSPSGDSVNEDDNGLPLVQGKADIIAPGIKPLRYTSSPTKICEATDIVMTVRAPVGYVVRLGFKACLGRGVCAIRANNVDDFLYFLLQSKESDWRKIEQGSTFTAVNSDDISTLTVYAPENFEEQQKIADFLSDLDTVISASEAEVAALEQQKKGAMQKIFSQEVRFRREDGTEYPAWEDLCLSEIVEPNNIPVENPGSNYVKLAIRSHCKGTFHKPVNSDDEGLDVDTMYLVEAYNLIVNITFAWEHAIAITKPEDAGTYVSHRFPQYKFVNGNLPSFYEYVIKNPRMKYEMGLCSPGGAGRNRVLNLKDFMKIQVVRPCPEEQQKIADFLSSFDAAIDLARQELEKWKLLKKGLMQQMFV